MTIHCSVCNAMFEDEAPYTCHSCGSYYIHEADSMCHTLSRTRKDNREVKVQGASITVTTVPDATGDSTDPKDDYKGGYNCQYHSE